MPTSGLHTDALLFHKGSHHLKDWCRGYNYHTCCVWGDSPSTMEETVHDRYARLIPRFRSLRRVPMPYRHVLPLKVMMRHQCLVVGAAQDMLTVGITDRQDISILTLLSKLTGRTIFPVLVDSIRINLLIQRIDRYQHSRGNVSDYLLYLHRLQIKAMVIPFTYQDTRRK
jgi:hypothetical protein